MQSVTYVLVYYLI